MEVFDANRNPDQLEHKKYERPVTDRLRLQRVFTRIKQCCLQPDSADYANYGGRGIYICDEWLASGTSEEFVQWALANGYRHGLDTDRTNNDGPYAPWNVRFVTPKENCRNMRRSFYVEYQGERVVLATLVEQKFGCSDNRTRSRIYRRIVRGWDIEAALSTPVALTKKAPQ